MFGEHGLIKKPGILRKKAGAAWEFLYPRTSAAAIHQILFERGAWELRAVQL
jgi:hypothetical protein